MLITEHILQFSHESPITDFWSHNSKERGLRNAELFVDQAAAFLLVVSSPALGYQSQTLYKHI